MADRGQDPMPPVAGEPPMGQPPAGNRLRHGVKGGDPSNAPRCGARARRTGAPCRQPATANGRCRLHGGKSTGPRTAEGLERLRAARTRHGAYGEEARELRELIRMLKARTKRLAGLT
jgi:hypothetical protein